MLKVHGDLLQRILMQWYLSVYYVKWILSITDILLVLSGNILINIEELADTRSKTLR